MLKKGVYIQAGGGRVHYMAWYVVDNRVKACRPQYFPLQGHHKFVYIVPSA
jgi:hypothetical protein